ncbi:phosphatase PAP2 family protein [Iamia sp. SCSIO 61187]|uniref:phosphatase PAP2 family protein n=1 Tax=Iamia sp. SCSIO 61187 TaxID=2722752 RepID=UPI001C62F1D7|nr:phosphatase PAP2 family protein [Iamia sp. SCSIO 61187]QYG91531.1 phosphatase PAP2 family protein [Iamia sp. SCSIO 61187]
MDDGPNPSSGVITPVRGVVVAAVATLVATTAAALPGDLVAGEVAVLRWANDLPRGVGAPMQLVMHLGASLGALVVVAVAALARRWRLAAAALVGLLVARLVAGGLKVAVDRARPPALLADVVVRQHLPADPGFPSAHAAVAAALAVVAGWEAPRLRIPLAALAVAIGLARLYVGVHLPLDVLGGWALGVLAGLAAVTVVHPRVPPHPGPAPWSGSTVPRSRRP